ncbi:MAG: hypothetical protein ACSLFD_10000 [Solirubrobacterales bacterium]
MQSLRAELTQEVMPEFTVLMPDGWERREPTDAVRDEMLDAAKARLMTVNRPDLYAQLLSMVRRSFSDMKRAETIAFFGPMEGAPDSSYLPASLTASIRRGSNGGSLDGAIAQLIRKDGATALDDDKRFLRWETDSTQMLDGTAVKSTSVLYLTPVPNTGHKRALQFMLVISHGTDSQEDQDFLQSIKDRFDAYISTFAWLSA